MSIRIKSDWGDIEKELRRLRNLPDGKASTVLDRAWAEIYATIKAQIHVETASLQASTKHDERSFGRTWQGSITFGGAAPGAVHPRVIYAEYERRRGGAHDFMAGFALYNERLAQAVKKAMGGGSV